MIFTVAVIFTAAVLLTAAVIFTAAARRFFKDDVGVDAAEAKRTDSRPPGLGFVVLRPGGKFSGDVNRELRPGDARTALLEVQVGRQFAVLQGQHGFNEASYARGRFGVADVGFNGAHHQRAGAALAQDGAQGFDFDRVAQGCAGAVRFDVVDLGGLEAGGGQGGADDGLLRQSVWHRQPT